MNLFTESSLTGSTILNIVIVIVLYNVAYVGYLATLWHPREWQDIPTWKKVLLTFLLLLTVLFCSTSATGVDFLVLIASTIFLVVLFLIIGASSFALPNGTHILWEYLARYSMPLIVGLLPAVAITGYWISSTKLNVLFGVAIFIEFVWLLHLHRANRLRVQQPLGEHSLAVLHSQAENDLDSFVKKHRIKEVVRSGDDIYWMGCTKHTPACPINYYVNKVGLNTPPCCLEHMKELCFDVDQALKEMGIPHWIDGGTLLGAVRENGQFLAWEDDVDISFMLNDSTSGDAFVSELKSKLVRQGYLVKSTGEYDSLCIYYTQPTPWLYGLEHHRYRGKICLDLVEYRMVNSYGKQVMERALYKGAMPQTESGGYGVPSKMIMPIGEIQLLGRMISCPADPDAYLRTMYGNYTEADYTYIDDQVAASRREIDSTKP